jgi:hypothetical protein
MADEKETGQKKNKLAKIPLAERAVTGAKNPRGTPRDRFNFALTTSRR